MNESEKAEVRQNKAVRGYIIRCLVKGYNNTALTRQLSNAMIAAGLVISPDISKHLDYLEDAGYIEFTEEKVTAYNAYAHDAVIKLTKEGVDLAKALGLPEDATEEEVRKTAEAAAKAAEKLKELEGNTSGEGEKVSEAAEIVANSTILSMLGLKADASGTGFHLSGRRR